jgi:hypothetical protein
MQDPITKDIFYLIEEDNGFVQIDGKVCFVNSSKTSKQKVNFQLSIFSKLLDTNEQMFVDVDEQIFQLMKELQLRINLDLIPQALKSTSAVNQNTGIPSVEEDDPSNDQHHDHEYHDDEEHLEEGEDQEDTASTSASKPNKGLCWYDSIFLILN